MYDIFARGAYAYDMYVHESTRHALECMCHKKRKVVRYVELGRHVEKIPYAIRGVPFLPRSISRSDYLYGYSLSLCELVLCLFCFYYIFWHISPSLPLAACLFHVSMRVNALPPGWSVLILFRFVSTGTYPRPSIWPPACSLVPEGWWCAHPHLYICVVVYLITSHSV